MAQCYGTRTDPLTAEVALAVAHGEQTLGVGTLLLEHLASRARRSGVRRFVADVLPENDRVRQVLTDVGLPVWRSGDGGEVSVELDLAPAGGYPAALAAREERADIRSLAAVLAPRSVLVVGAGRGSDSVGHAVLRNVVRAGFPGRLVAVNPHATQVCGVDCLRSVDELTEPVDLAVLCVPSSAVPKVAEQCGRRGVRALLVISSGLSGEPALATGLLDAVRRHDMRMVGPNCLGIVNTDPAVQLDATFAEPAPAGVVGLVTQSGGVAVAVQQELGRLGLGVSTAVSTGDKYDVSGNDMLLWWHGDERTRVAVLYLESFGNPRKFSRFARRLAERMPVVTVRSGSSAAGQRAAASHTASTATPRVTRDALFRQAGVLAVDRIDELTELVATLSWQPLPAGRRTAIVVNAGGVGVLAADACEAHGLIVAPLSDRTQRTLRRLLPRGAATANPVDTSAVVPPEVFASAVSAVRVDPGVDAVLVATVATALTDPFPGVASAAAEKGIPVVAVRLGQAEHVTGLPVPGAGATVPVFADAAAAAGGARAGGHARGVAGPAAGHRGAARRDRRRPGGWRRGPLPRRASGGRLVGARAGAGRSRGVRAARPPEHRRRRAGRGRCGVRRGRPPRGDEGRRGRCAAQGRRGRCATGARLRRVGMPRGGGVLRTVRATPARVSGAADGARRSRAAGGSDQRSFLRAAGHGRVGRYGDGSGGRPGALPRAVVRRGRRGDARRLPRRRPAVRRAR